MIPRFLTVEDVTQVHAQHIARYGGSHGVRDREALDAAIAAPAAKFQGEFVHEDVCAMSAAYLHEMVHRRPFSDANERTALICALLFLALNGIDLDHSTDELLDLTLAAAAGRLDRSAVARRLRSLMLREMVHAEIAGRAAPSDDARPGSDPF